MDTGGKQDGTVIYPLGIYNNLSPKKFAGGLVMVTLSHDKTFARQAANTGCTSGPNDPCRVVNGTYSFSHYGASRYIRFNDSNGKLMDRYAFTTENTGNKLNLRLTGQSTSFYVINQATTRLNEGDQCADDKGNALGFCVDPLFCEYNGSGDDAIQTCEPPI